MRFIDVFAGHRIAANLLMLVMLLSGWFVAGRVEVRFFPAFEIQTAVVSAAWPQAAAEDVGEALLQPLENELRNVPEVKNISSYARDGYGVVYLEFAEDTDMQKATDDIRRHLDIAAAKLPAESERPETHAAEQRRDVMRLWLSGASAAELRPLARRLESELLNLGAARVQTDGLPRDEIQIRIPRRRLAELRLTPRDIGRQLAAQNIDTTAGKVGGAGTARLLRAVSEKRTLRDFYEMPIRDGGGNVMRLGDIADIRRAAKKDATTILLNGKPAVEFRLTQSGGNIIATAERVYAWMEEARARLPAGVELTAHSERWRAVRSRMNLLVENGIQGLILVVLFLLLFLRARVALWVAAGIPATFMVALAVLYAAGGTINMISMFAFIMVTGIVVDDAIVVGENSLHRLRQGEAPFAAAVNGAREMFPAVLSSTFTTIASFLPLFIIGGTIGAIVFAIPLVVVCVLVASLFECFLVLPGHMRDAFAAAKTQTPRWREALDGAFMRFQEGAFRRSVRLALRYRWVTVAAAFAALILTFSLLAGGFLKYRFFPGAELNRVQAQISFVAGTPRETVAEFSARVVAAARLAEGDFPEEERLLRHIAVYLGQGGRQGGGEEYAVVRAELSQPDERDIGTAQFTRAWKKRLPKRAGLERLVLREARGGPGGEDLEIRLSGADVGALKAAAEELKSALAAVPGVSRPSDDTPYGKPQTVFELTPRGRALGLTADDIARQMRDAFNGYRAQTLREGVDETEVRVLADDAAGFPALFRLRLQNGDEAALADAATLRERRGFDTILRADAQPVVHVAADVDFEATETARVIAQLEAEALPALAARHGVSYSFEGKSADQRETLDDMGVGLVIALLLIFVILAAVFESWTLPIAILLTVPFGVIGAMLGHWLLGYTMSILSIFGVFTLNGIIINDSIILVREYLARKRLAPEADNDALLTDAACRRFRAILLTSLTTVGGLLPLLFERSTQAQFLIPMAISVGCGLAFATLLILYLMPAYVSIHESITRRLTRPPPPPAAPARAVS